MCVRMHKSRFEPQLRHEPRNRRRADIVAAPDFGKRFLAPVAALDRLFLLVRGKLRRSAHSLPARHGSRPAFPGPGADKVALELCKPAQHGEHKPPV